MLSKVLQYANREMEVKINLTEKETYLICEMCPEPVRKASNREELYQLSPCQG